MSRLAETDPDIYQAIVEETKRQNRNLELIASENFASEAVLEAQGSVLTNKYAEGYPAARWYGGCEHMDTIERLAIERAKALFGAEHANVQPHSGAQANMAVYFGLLNPGEKVMAMDLAHGGHLTHGHPKNFSGRLFQMVPYGVSRRTEQLDYDEIAAIAAREHPRMIIVGATAYPRQFDFPRFRAIADSIGAYVMVDMAHFAGLVAAGVHPNPVPYADVVTTTTHKTLRGPRGGMILCREAHRKALDLQVFPGLQGGPLMHVIAAKAVALKEAMSPAFATYARQVVQNARALAAQLLAHGFRIVSNGTDTHLVLVDVTSRGLTGREAAVLLDEAHITVNKNLIPFDTRSAMVTSAVRLGTPAVTTRGMREAEMTEIAALIDAVLAAPADPEVRRRVARQVTALTERFPLYPERLAACEGRVG